MPIAAQVMTLTKPSTRQMALTWAAVLVVLAITTSCTGLGRLYPQPTPILNAPKGKGDKALTFTAGTALNTTDLARPNYAAFGVNAFVATGPRTYFTTDAYWAGALFRTDRSRPYNRMLASLVAPAFGLYRPLGRLTLMAQAGLPIEWFREALNSGEFRFIDEPLGTNVQIRIRNITVSGQGTLAAAIRLTPAAQRVQVQVLAGSSILTGLVGLYDYRRSGTLGEFQSGGLRFSNFNYFTTTTNIALRIGTPQLSGFFQLTAYGDNFPGRQYSSGISSGIYACQAGVSLKLPGIK